MSDLPTNMRALVHDNATHLTTLTTVPLPVPSASEYLLRVHATTFTTNELLWASPNATTIPGIEFSATVVTAPSPTSRFPPGSHVYARVSFPRPGAAREYTVALEEELALAPQNISKIEAAAVPLQALTAWQALFVHGGLDAPLSGQQQPPASDGEQRSPRRILVLNGGGSVGSFVIQLAALTGSTVVTTTGAANVPLVRSLGAREVLDYRAVSLPSWAAEDESHLVDLVFDCIGGKAGAEAWAALRPGGTAISIVPAMEEIPGILQSKGMVIDIDRPSASAEVKIREGVKGKVFIMVPHGKQLGEVTKLIEEEKCKPVVDSVYEFDEWEKALKKSQSGHVSGKVVLKIQG